MAIVSHNTEAMKSWSGIITNSAAEYDELINSLYNLVDNLVAADFTGGLSQDFENSVLEKRDEFHKLSELLGECSELISKTSSSIESDEAELKSRIQSHNMFN